MNDSTTPLRIGTRGSDLALWQARHVAAAIGARAGAPPVEIVVIHTEGDRITDVPLSQVAGKAFFTKEIEEALLDRRVDLAVHSLKDLATRVPDGLEVGAVLEREDPRDALLAAAPIDLDRLPRGARVGTSSLRRRAMLARARPDVERVELRGNVPTRIERMLEGRYDAILLAAAGVRRLGLTAHLRQHLSLERFLPAVAQGAMAVEIRAGDERVRGWIEPLDHAATRAATRAERALLARLEGGCQIPVGALGTVAGGVLTLRAEVCSLDGRETVAGARSGAPEAAESVGAELADELVGRGAAEILERIRAGSDGGVGSEGVSDLAGRGVAITRAEGARGPLSRRLAARGASVVDWAALRFGPPADPRPLERALSRLESYDWLVVTSGRAAAALAEATGESASRPAGPRVAAVGPATAAELLAHGWRVDRVGAGPGAAALVASFAATGDAGGARILFPASAEARPELADGLRALGASVDQVEVYRPLPSTLEGARCRSDLESGGVDAVLFASPSALAALGAACGEAELRSLLADPAVVSIGPTTSAALASFGRAPDAEAAPSTFDGLVEAVARLLAEPGRPRRAAAATPSSGGTR